MQRSQQDVEVFDGHATLGINMLRLMGFFRRDSLLIRYTFNRDPTINGHCLYPGSPRPLK